jgi:three-Cys-motif partner protein
MPDETIWELEPHTAAKHQLLKSYLNAWFPILSTYERKVLFLDGFAGPGRYQGGEPGSPIIALETLLDHSFFPRMTNTQFLFAFFESESDRADNLEQELRAYFQKRPQPANVGYWVKNTTFVEGAEDILARMGAGKVLAPTFAFIDPFGFGGIPIDVMGRLLAYDKCEVLVNFMFDSVNRFATAKNPPGVNATYEELFGCDEFNQAPPTGRSRQDFLVELYKRQLQQHGFPFVRSMEMVSLERNRTVYHLVHGTRHLTGVKAMKRAMWKLDPSEGRRFTPSEADILQLFGATPDLARLRRELFGQFRGRTVSIEAVEAFVTESTDFMEDAHLKRGTLVPMETEGKIVNVQGRKRANSFPAGCQITFARPRPGPVPASHPRRGRQARGRWPSACALPIA